MSALRVLMVEDSLDDAELIAIALKRGGYALEWACVEDEAQMRDALRERWDIIIADYTLPRFSGMAALALLAELCLDTPLILVSGKIGEDVAVSSLQAGAYDYVMKHQLSRLKPAVEHSLREVAVRRERDAAQARLRESEERLRTIISNLPCVVFQLLRRRSHGLCPYRLRYVSEGSLSLLGHSPSELQDDSMRFFRLVEPGDRRALITSLVKSAKQLTPAHCEIRVTPRSGTVQRWVSAQFNPRTLPDGTPVWDGTLADITPTKQSEREIMESRQQLAELSAHLEAAKEDERTRIAREIHDDIGGNLTAVKIDLAWLSRHAGSALVAEKIGELMGLVDDTMAVTSRIGRDLRPGILDLGLLAAIEWQSEEFARRMSLACVVSSSSREFDLPQPMATALFSIFRETLTNIAKHANASRVEISLHESERQIELTVCDNGRGIEDTDLRKPGSFGLRGMRERADQLGGSLLIKRGPEGGAVFTVRLPLPARDQRRQAEAA